MAPVRTSRFNPVLWLTIVTLAAGITAPLGSVMAPKTAASWVCDHAHAENTANSNASSMKGLDGPRLVDAMKLPIMNAADYLCIAYKSWRGLRIGGQGSGVFADRDRAFEFGNGESGLEIRVI